MAAGLGFKTFTTGEVLTAANVNGYLMQGVLVFASAAARDAAITSPQEGQFAYTKDTNGLWYYDGAAWVASGATGDIEGVTAGIGISGGGTSGTVTVTNSMATAIDAKGDLVAGTGADTFAKLTVGANNTVLTADSAEATGLKWATPAASGFVGCRVYNTTNQNLSNNVSTTLTFDSENFDTNGFHSTATNTSRITIPTGKGGYYQFRGSIYFSTGSSSGVRGLSFAKNGGTGIFSSDISGQSTQTLNVSSIVNLSAGDYVEWSIYQNSGITLAAYGSSDYTFIDVVYLGA